MGQSRNYDHLFDLDCEPLEDLLSKVQISSQHFSGKTVFLTGGARGIGKEAAIGLGYLGANVVIVDKRKNGQQVTDDINATGGKSLFIHADVSLPENIKKAFQRAHKEFGKIDILINNAVHFTIATFEEMSVEEWDLTQRTNIGAMMHAIKWALPEMREDGHGIIMNLVGPEGMAYAAAMSSSKVAMRSLLYSLSSEIGSDEGISILGFAPGFVSTPLVADVFVKYCERIDVDFEEYVCTISRNQGYKGLMPVAHCAASLIHTLANASEFHGLIADAFIPLEKYKIIDVNNDETPTSGVLPKFTNSNTISRYISEVSSLNRRIESKIEQRTKEITREKDMVINLLKEIQHKNKQLEIIKDELIIAKNSAEEASVHKEEFLTNVTHEIRTPLNAIIGFIDLLKDSELSGEQREHINAVQISGEKLLKLINEVLDISKIEAGKLELEPEVFDLPQFLKDLEKSTKARASSKDNKLKLVIDAGLPKLVLGDPNRLHQILINLVGNAIKFTKAGEVEIRAEVVNSTEENHQIAFFIKDNGIGIPKENIKSIFETFTQVKGQRNRIHGGSGLGLAIVCKLVELNNGHIAVSSEVGEGSEFKVEIPLGKVNSSEINYPKSVNIDKKALEGLNILLAEDNKFNQLLEIRILENLGANVSLAENGREAIDQLKKGAFHLVLMDIQMPELDGIDATRFIREQMKMEVPIIALTANAFRQELDKCLDAGMNCCVTKPFKKEVLIQKILENVTSTVT